MYVDTHYGEQKTVELGKVMIVGKLHCKSYVGCSYWSQLYLTSGKDSANYSTKIAKKYL